MITTLKQALEVQTRRRNAGKKGVAKAVRRWAKREGHISPTLIAGITNTGAELLSGNFDGCRRFDQIHK